MSIHEVLQTVRILPMRCRCALCCFVTSHENLRRIGVQPHLTCFFIFLPRSDGASSSQGGGPGVQSAAQAAAVAQAAAAAAQRETTAAGAPQSSTTAAGTAASGGVSQHRSILEQAAAAQAPGAEHQATTAAAAAAAAAEQAEARSSASAIGAVLGRTVMLSALGACAFFGYYTWTYTAEEIETMVKAKSASEAMQDQVLLAPECLLHPMSHTAFTTSPHRLHIAWTFHVAVFKRQYIKTSTHLQMMQHGVSIM